MPALILDGEILKDSARGKRTALIAPGPSLNSVNLDVFQTYDMTVAISEAYFVWPLASLLTCFDPSAARKTRSSWSETTQIIMQQQDAKGFKDAEVIIYETPTMTECQAGSLGMALGLCNFMGVTKLDLWGVDLCQTDPEEKYAAGVREQHPPGTYFGGHSLEKLPTGKWANLDFIRFARAIESHQEEWAHIDIRNMNPDSALNCFRKVAPPCRDPGS